MVNDYSGAGSGDDGWGSPSENAGDLDLATDPSTDLAPDEAPDLGSDEVAADFDSLPDEFGATTDDFEIETADVFPADAGFSTGRADADSAASSTPEGAPAGEIDVALLDGIERELADVELALARLGDGTYGRCESCGQVLTEDELEASPTGRFCRAHLPLDLS